ncbi:3-hydroxyacyl-CoA dehydrogenase NAD-binding domain-containing protein [Brevibacillus massiliensis]|jgi:3-hydroxybutyryl-CoA dehydrogenase|uniref:3-hydroxyacyl-CoA dehydrogenase NAD-binding domain-containing protein n=1 Tax=Brevibacillus massiliensis TaxID=1118054 RepID=UPI0002DAFBC0|nr:3-hydroxyacyl-CoA dehydrogenase NAD-binding domain-containing protein [Brevibacillus massiliensis]
MNAKTVGVVGSGTMGSGIAQVISQSGSSVLLYDINETVVNRAIAKISGQLDRLHEKGKLSEADCLAAKERIRPAVNLVELQHCELVIEAAPERLEIKRDLFRQLDECCRRETILATNTSSFSVTEMGGFTSRAERVAGLHFFNPAPLMPLVEVIRGIKTAEETVSWLYRFACDLGKSPVICEDTPGFIVNRVARPYYNEALRILGDRIATAEQIDRIMKKAGAFRMGPFELQDLIGIDINFSTTESVHAGFFGDPRFRPHTYQQRMMQAGKLGRKAGGGFYDYDE